MRINNITLQDAITKWLSVHLSHSLSQTPCHYPRIIVLSISPSPPPLSLFLSTTINLSINMAVINEKEYKIALPDVF